MKKTLTLLFFTHLLTRTLFAIALGFYNNYQLQPDSGWLVNFGDQALTGNFNFELNRFIASPLYPLIVALFKFIFISHWNTALIIFQLIISSISGVFIFKIALLLFKNEKVALLSSLAFAVFPLTIWYVNTFSQECLFQSLLIFTIYYLLAAIKYSSIKKLIAASILFSLAYLTKSHILLFSLFIPLIFYHNFKLTGKTILYSFLFGSVALVFSLPYGLYQLKKNSSYVISSNGFGYQFYLGNTQAGYKTIVDVPEKNSSDYDRIKDITANAGYFNGSQSLYDSVLSLPQKEKQRAFIAQSLKWINENPLSFFKLKVYDAIFFLLPGVSFRHYSFSQYILSFLFSFPVYLLAYIGIISEARKHFELNSYMIYLFISMLLFSTILYSQNRFRTITLEPFYIIYFSEIFYRWIEKFPAVRVLRTITTFYLNGPDKNMP